MLKRALPYLALAGIVLGFVNFFWFMFESQAIGGDALGGHITNGHYFVGSHGSFTEVDKGTWEWSRFHASSIFPTHMLAMASGAFLLFRYIFPAYMGLDWTSAARVERVASIRASGPVIESAKTSGGVGSVNLSGPLLTISVHPGGVIVKPVFTPEYAILPDEILEISKRRFGGGTEIRHAGRDAASPLRIYKSLDDPLIRAIAGLPRTPVDTGTAVTRSTRTSPSMGLLRALGQSRMFQPIPANAAPRGIVAVLEWMGIGVGIVLIASGFFWTIPRLGGFGVVWTIFAIVITGINLAKILRRRSGR